MRLIDAYALQGAIYKSKIQNPHKDTRTAANHEFEHDHFMQIVALQPTAQEEIVRCQDCRHYIPRESVFSEEIQFFKCRILDIDTDPEWFCACGERRETE